eukprot:10157706-Prorocentrum_lima.AAC.1
MEAIPKNIQFQCKKYGIFDSVGILVRVMREVMPAADYSRLSMASDVQTMPTQVPVAKAGLAKWLEDHHS